MYLLASIGGAKLSQKAVNVLEQGGGMTAFISAIGGIASANHDLIWAAGVTVGSIAAIIGIALNILREKRAREIHALEIERLKNEVQSLDSTPT